MMMMMMTMMTMRKKTVVMKQTLRRWPPPHLAKQLLTMISSNFDRWRCFWTNKIVWRRRDGNEVVDEGEEIDYFKELDEGDQEGLNEGDNPAGVKYEDYFDPISESLEKGVKGDAEKMADDIEMDEEGESDDEEEEEEGEEEEEEV